MTDVSFGRIEKLPPYLFAEIDQMKLEARRRGEDIIDLGMGNPDLPAPPPVVEKLIEAAQNPKNHRYSASRGIYKLRVEISRWYKRHYDVEIDPDSEAIVTIGSKEGLSHLILAMIEPGDVVLVPNPAYPIHTYAVIIAGGDLRSVPLTEDEEEFLGGLRDALKLGWPRPKLLILNFPNNPTTRTVSLDFFQKVVEFARENGIFIIHDLAYADLVFDGYKAPSILQVPGAKEVAVEFYTLSKGYNMAGWRVGFAVGNKKMIHALARLKSYFDYGIFQPIQIAAIIALRDGDPYVEKTRLIYQSRRDVLVEGLCRIGWKVEKPKATMFVWAPIPEPFRKMGSLQFSKLLLQEAKVAVSPGIGFGEYGEGHVRFALVENEHRIKQAIRGIRRLFWKWGLVSD
jgi:alanine-synthesizing transaminase